MTSFYKLYESFLKLNKTLILTNKKEKSEQLIERFTLYLKNNKQSLQLIESYNEFKDSILTLNSKDRVDYILEYFNEKRIEKKEFFKETENFIKFLKESNIYIKNNELVINNNNSNDLIDLFENYIVRGKLTDKIGFIDKLNSIVESNVKVFEEKINEEKNKTLIPYKELVEKYIFSTNSPIQFKNDIKELLEKKLGEYKDNVELVDTLNKCIDYKNKILENNDMEKVYESTLYLFKILENMDEYKDREF